MLRPASRRRGLVGASVLLLSLVLALSGCTINLGSGDDGGSDGSSDGASSSGETSGSSNGPGGLSWRSCDGGFKCATLSVPLDYEKPDGAKIKVALAMRPAADKSERVGSLVVNPGGPGGSGIDLAESSAFPKEVTDHFDVVGFDPRGVGRSTALDCHSHLQEMYDTDPTMEDAADESAYLKISQEYVDECESKDGKLLPHMGTLDVARDMDQIRGALGEDKLNYLGYSYGTSIGQMYAQLFPTKIRTMVLDGVVDTEQTGLQGADSQADGFKQALDAYLDDCASDSSCELGSDPRGQMEKLVAAAEADPIRASSADRPATPGVVQLAIGAALYSKSSWPILSEAIKQGLDGDGSLLVRLADSYLSRNSDGTYANGFDVYFAVSCLDSSWPKDPDEIFANAKQTGAKDPLVGEGLVNDYVRCALWPVDPQPLPKVTAEGSPPIVVISTTRDPATPYESGVKVADRLPQGVLITNEGDGHTVFGQGKACVDDAVSDYLVKAEPPEDGLRCSG